MYIFPLFLSHKLNSLVFLLFKSIKENACKHLTCCDFYWVIIFREFQCFFFAQARKVHRVSQDFCMLSRVLKEKEEVKLKMYISWELASIFISNSIQLSSSSQILIVSIVNSHLLYGRMVKFCWHFNIFITSASTWSSQIYFWWLQLQLRKKYCQRRWSSRILSQDWSRNGSEDWERE